MPRFALCGAVFRSAAIVSECNRFRWWEALAQSRVLERGRVFRLSQALQSRKPLCGLGERDGQVHTRVHGRVLLEVRHKVGVRSPGGLARANRSALLGLNERTSLPTEQTRTRRPPRAETQLMQVLPSEWPLPPLC